MIDIVARVISAITSDPRFDRLMQRLSQRDRGVLGASGLWGSSAPLLAAAAFQATRRPILYVTAHLTEADEALDDLETFAETSTDLLGAWEALPSEGSAGGEIHEERLRLCAHLASNVPTIVVAPIQALMQPVPTPAALRANTLSLAVGERSQPEAVTTWLADRGFTRLERVESPGDFAQRGDLVDIYPFDRESPVRLEFFDEAVEAVRTFDVGSQRSTATLKEFRLVAIPYHAKTAAAETTLFSTYLPDDTVVFLDSPAEVHEFGMTFWRRLGQPAQLREPSSVLRGLTTFDQIHLTRLGAAVGALGDVFAFDVRSLARFEGKTEAAVAELCAASRDHHVAVYCANDGERSRVRELIGEHAGGVPEALELLLGVVHRGFECVSTRTLVVPHHEVFHRAPARRLRRSHASRPLESWLDLVPGDIVVHVLHGIARFKGMKTIQKAGTNKVEEFLTLEFADQAVLHVTMSQIDLIQKYIGAGGGAPTLSTLGGGRWKKTKDKVTDAVSELAESLLRIQAARAQGEGVAYPTDTDWQREFEDEFPYRETEDQVVVAAEIKNDLSRHRPMDRLVCGDVGYGKTELAMRAAFKVAEYGRQVAVLVPTTVLAEQHFRTMTQRFADYPFHVAVLSRFKSAAEQRDIVEQTKNGRVDILVGTHRMLSKDVRFADLGLVVIDEEQRFGVEHKERLKHLRASVDVLALSATPIPRTLHMALVGLRDISSLQTPPLDRRAIATTVSHYSAALVRDAIIRELNRDGQVYFVNDTVHAIEGLADDLRKIVPEARFIVGHGQMKTGQLDEVMHKFLDRKADVLVATTIIESGLDIPTVNTIFINHADRFGLADLHQLRGRIGRSSHRGYCYFLIPPDRPLTGKAVKRLKAIEEFSDLGAGFRIAMRDLEIRGAGNLLGAEQSGNIAAVGYEMYCQLLERAVHRLQGEPDLGAEPVHLELNVPAHIPKAYIAAERTRIDLYRRIAACRTAPDLEQLRHDLVDVFGRFPQPVERLLDLAEIRVLAAPHGIRSIILHPPDLVLTVDDLAAVNALFTPDRLRAGTARTPDARTIHLRLPPAYLESPTLLATLRRLLTVGPTSLPRTSSAGRVT